VNENISVNIHFIFRKEKCDKNRNQNILNLLNYNRNTAYVVCEIISDTSNNTGNWNYLRIIQKIFRQPTLSDNHNIKELQKIVMLSTGHIFWKVVQIQITKNFHAE